MPEIIIHIGFAKCASTTLQNLVFKGEEGYLGTHQELKKADNYGKQFKASTPVGPRQWSDFRQIRKWVEEVKQKHDHTVERFLLSDEMLTNKNKFNNRPIIPFLKKFSNEIWVDGPVKVILILRNHAERMASSYAQVANINPFASQADFEKHISRTLHKGHAQDYSKWVGELYEVLGQENVLILLMEEIGEISFWEQLNTFRRLTQFQPSSI